MSKARKNAKHHWNMVKNCIQNFFYKVSEIFGRKRSKYPSKLNDSPQNCKYFPPKAKFPRNEIPKFRIFPCIDMSRLQAHLTKMSELLNFMTIFGIHMNAFKQVQTCQGLVQSVCTVPSKGRTCLLLHGPFLVRLE